MGKHRYRVERTVEAEQRRDTALLFDEKRYEGDQCPIRGHGAIRYTRNRSCVDCAREACLANARKNGVKPLVDKYPQFAHLPRAERKEVVRKINQQIRDLGKVRKPELARKHNAAWAAKNVSYITAKSKLRKEAKRNRTPPWLTDEHKAQMKAFYEEAIWQTILTGVQHHVDHIYPLQGSRSSGLHVPWNLRVMPGRANVSKGNQEPAHEDEPGWWIG